MAIPIVFIHRGNDEFLTYSLRQAKLSNPLSEVILIGDSLNGKHESVRHCRLEQYFAGAEQFAAVYRHHSPNAYDYELFCFQRWFILRDFLRAERLPVYCYLDSDIMLYTGVDKPEYQRFPYICTWFNVNSLDTLERYCQLMLDHFSDPELYEALLDYTEQLGHPAVSDMVFSSLYKDSIPGDFEEMDQEAMDYGIYKGLLLDANINFPYNMYSPDFPTDFTPIEMCCGKKKIYLIEGSLYCKYLLADTFVRIGYLHFQGPENKTYIPYFFANWLAGAESAMFFDYDSCEWLPCGEG